jgi:hypothetical protein
VVDIFGDISTLGFDHDNANQAMLAPLYGEDNKCLYGASKGEPIKFISIQSNHLSASNRLYCLCVKAECQKQCCLSITKALVRNHFVSQLLAVKTLLELSTVTAIRQT